MNRDFFKIFLGGALIGTLIFFAPFVIIKVLFALMLFKLIFRLFSGRSHRNYQWAYADKIRSMSDDEFNEYKSNYRNKCYR